MARSLILARIKSASIILDRQHEVLSLHDQGKIKMASTGMAKRVFDGFLGNPE